MDRWTLQQLKDTDDLTFAIAILDERQKYLSQYSPLKKKLQEAMFTLDQIRKERDRYLAKVAEMDMNWQEVEPESEVTDLSGCPEEIKGEIIRNAELLEQREITADDDTFTGYEDEEESYAGDTEERYAV